MIYTISTPLVHLGKKETPVSCYLTRVCKKYSVPRADTFYRKYKKPTETKRTETQYVIGVVFSFGFFKVYYFFTISTPLVHLGGASSNK